MKRRAFIAGLGGAAAWPVVAYAQQRAMPVIGFLSGASRDDTRSPDDGFRQGLAEAGYIEGRNLTIEYRWAEAHFDRLQALADDLVTRHVALIATVTLPAAVVAKFTSPTTPVVFVIGEDPVKAGLVASLDRPGSNATGVSDFVNSARSKTAGTYTADRTARRVRRFARQSHESQRGIRQRGDGSSGKGAGKEVIGCQGDK